MHINARRMDFYCIQLYALVRFIIQCLRWLKATNVDIAIGKYVIGLTPFIKDEKFRFL